MITESDPDDRMPPPPANPLTSAQINLIYTWIAQGARNNTCTNSCDTSNVTFSGTIFPLLQNSCIGCHSGAAAGGQIDLSSYQGVASVANNGRLLGAISHSPGFQPMPRGGNKLPDCRIDQVRIWIEGGALNN
jgi:mono/diheme cytochrome c family protein